MPDLLISTLGRLSIERDGQPVSGLASRKAEALLVYLACNPRPHPREVLADLLWDGRTQSQALANLRVVLSSLRKEVGDWLTISRDTAGIRPDADLSLDVVELEAALGLPLSARTLEAYETALALYQGDFLEGIYLREASRFEEWQVRERERLHRLVLDGLQKLVDHSLSCGSYQAGTGHANRLLALEPLSETAHRQLMELLVLSGQREQALGQYETCRQLLEEELGVEPAAETMALLAEIRSGTLGPPLPSPPPMPPHNLPAQTTTFVGRRRELAEAAALLEGSRLLTLTGAGGSGKTRLALELARQELPSFPDGVYFVSLASLQDPRLVDQTIAAVLDVKPRGGQSVLQALHDRLAHKQTLLILDNYEHLLEAATVASDLLSAAGRLRVVATSREPLQLRGEQRYPVPPLELPVDSQLSRDDMAQVEAVQLFVLRAQAADPAFRLTADNLPPVAGICRRLDGLPLALELAAARLDTVSPEMLLERLSSRLGALSRGLRDLPRRQQTLRDTIAWSTDLLSEEERLLFSRLGVFVGRWTLTDAEAVCGPGLPLDAAIGLESLAAKNLVRLVEGPLEQPCYDMLATIREFAAEQLQVGGEQTTIHKRLARHMADHLPVAMPPDPYASGRPAWFGLLTLELDNIRTALAYFLDHGEVEQAQKIIGLVSHFWTERHVEEGSAWLDRLLALLGDEPTAARGKALAQQGGLYLYGFDNQRAKALYEESVQCHRASEDQRGLFDALSGLGQAYHALGDYERMRQTFDEAAAIAETLGDKSALRWALALSVLGTTDFRHTHATVQRCLALAIEEGEPGTMYKQWLADTEIRLGNYDTAAAMLPKCRSSWCEMGRDHDVPYALFLLGEAELRRGRLQEAGRVLAEGLEIASGFADVDYPPYFYERFAPLAAAQGDFERAAQLFGAAEAARELPGGSALNPEYRPAYEQDVAAVRAAMAEEAFNAAWRRGQAMTIDEATAYALRR